MRAPLRILKIGEPKQRQNPPEMTSHNVVSDNHIHDIGQVFPAAVGVWVGQSSYNTISHNHIHDTYYTGISVGWTWGYTATQAHHNIIEYNDVHDIGRGWLSDMGGIYTLGVQPGTVIRNNLFHHIESYSYGGWGIYTDEGSSQILIENNVAHHAKSAGFHQHYGQENIVRNNIFAYNREHQVMRSRNEDHVSFTFEQNIVIWNEGDLLGSTWDGDDRYFFDRNLYWDERQGEIRFAKWSFEEWQARGLDTRSMIADPMFVDPHKDHFTLKPVSPAFALGFKAIDLSQVGPRKEYVGK